MKRRIYLVKSIFFSYSQLCQIKPLQKQIYILISIEERTILIFYQSSTSNAWKPGTNLIQETIRPEHRTRSEITYRKKDYYFYDLKKCPYPNETQEQIEKYNWSVLIDFIRPKNVLTLVKNSLNVDIHEKKNVCPLQTNANFKLLSFRQGWYPGLVKKDLTNLSNHNV